MNSPVGTRLSVTPDQDGVRSLGWWRCGSQGAARCTTFHGARMFLPRNGETMLELRVGNLFYISDVRLNYRTG
ncbi:MAG: hypothetical protein M0P38_08845 [Bacteroidales bacterium]|nr:hypothetical protein [Bacteroidales bacterium]